ncbi:MAG: glycosyltransferase family 4 protein [Gammaproteobacteria bacterium]|nr:glycosyltransferase family 4 protein [Gammaproteobacteria bacterium]
MPKSLGVWFPLVRRNTGVDVYTERLSKLLEERGVRTQIDWIPGWAEFFPWTAKVPKPPSWATHVHINSWLHRRFIPDQLPLIVTLHSCVHDPNLTPYKSFAQKLYHRIWIRYCENYSFAQAKAIVAVSHYTAKATELAFGLSDIKTIPNWVDIKTFKSTQFPPSTLPFNLLFVGNLSIRKGADLLPKIMKQLGPEFLLKYTGKPEYFDTQLPKNMISVGKVQGDDLLNLYSESHALLFPTRLEGLPLSVLEALAMGRPVITSNCSSLPELVQNDKNGYLCKKDNVNDFVESVRKLAKSQEHYNQLSAAARDTVESSFTEEKSVDSYLELYKNVSQE